jgi:hypothetical protein
MCPRRESAFILAPVSVFLLLDGSTGSLPNDAMAARRYPKTESGEMTRLAARVAEVEQRLRLLEARVRQVAPVPKRPKAKPRAVPPRPRCPGCLLELPKGRRGDSCVWCGFSFDAVEKQALRK